MDFGNPAGIDDDGAIEPEEVFGQDGLPLGEGAIDVEFAAIFEMNVGVIAIGPDVENGLGGDHADLAMLQRDGDRDVGGGRRSGLRDGRGNRMTPEP